MTDYIWRGLQTGLSIPDDKGDVAGGILWEGIAVPGKRLSGLPAEHPRVVALVAQKLLVPAPPQAATAAAPTAPAKTED